MRIQALKNNDWQWATRCKKGQIWKISLLWEWDFLPDQLLVQSGEPPELLCLYWRSFWHLHTNSVYKEKFKKKKMFCHDLLEILNIQNLFDSVSVFIKSAYCILLHHGWANYFDLSLFLNTLKCIFTHTDLNTPF